MPIRLSTMADIPILAEVHVACWRETYPGIVSAETLADLSVDERRIRREKSFTDPDPRHLRLTATDDAGEIIGFSEGGPARKADLPAPCEVYGIYLLNKAKRLGIGRAMMAMQAAHLVSFGFGSMMIEVATGNAPARRFYEALGGRIAAAETCHSVGGLPIPSIIYVFDDLAALAG